MTAEILLSEGPVSNELIGDSIAGISEDRQCGAMSVFLGQVREDKVGNRVVRAIEYSAYEEMIRNEASEISRVIKAAFSDIRSIRIVHSTGLVKAGEISLFVLVSAGHRDHATRACRQVVELIKEKYPVWKKEIFDDESERWKDGEKK